jgi:hypothetical protein
LRSARRIFEVRISSNCTTLHRFDVVFIRSNRARWVASRFRTVELFAWQMSDFFRACD